MNSDTETLLQFASYGEQPNRDIYVLDTVRDNFANEMSPEMNAPRSEAPSKDSAVLAIEIHKIVESAVAAQLSNVAPPRAQSSGKTSQDSGFGETVARTAAMMTGAGPLVMGLMNLFGPSDPEPLPVLERFNAPASVSVEAGLTSGRDYSAIRYAQGGIPQGFGGASTRSAEMPTVQVNIQAMDSQSFLDRQDDIARAVREAMLHSNSLNDVVLEL